jgi:membrane protein YqaA with SNARE-associated domain
MTRLHKTITTLLSTMGLIIGGWLGYQLAEIAARLRVRWQSNAHQ